MENFLGNRIANIKIATLIVAVINLGFIGHSYYRRGAEEAYLSCVIICFIVSFVWTMAIIVKLVNQDEDNWKKADMLWHMIACVFYLVTLICFFASLVDIGKYARKLLWERIVSLLLGIVNTLLYGLAGFMFYKSG